MNVWDDEMDELDEFDDRFEESYGFDEWDEEE